METRRLRVLFSYLEQAGMEGQYNYNRGWENWMDNQLGDCPQGPILDTGPCRSTSAPAMRDRCNIPA